MRSLLADMLPNPAVERDGLQAALAGRPSAFRAPAAPHTSTLNDSPSRSSMTATGRLHSMASGSFRDAKLERPVSGAELRRLLVASRPVAAVELSGKLSFNAAAQPASRR